MRSNLFEKHYDFVTRETRTSSAIARIVSVSELREFVIRGTTKWWIPYDLQSNGAIRDISWGQITY